VPFVDAFLDVSTRDTARSKLSIWKNNLSVQILLAFAVCDVGFTHQTIRDEMALKTAKDAV
jgi:hypothetical protein